MIILSCNNITKSYIAEKTLNNVSFAINDGEKVGLVGLNGAGKTTLFKILTDEISRDSGDIYLAKKTKIGYLKQNTTFNSEKTVYDETLTVFENIIQMEKDLRDLEKDISIEGKKQNSEKLDNLMNRYSRLMEKFTENNGYGYESEVRGVLKGLGFSEEEFNQPINNLSGGQKTRVTLAKLLLEKPNLLLLDEPTNHLDIDAINWLERYIREYKGAAIIISHDRYFLDSTVSKILQLENNQLKSYNGNYSVYIQKRKKELELLTKNYEQQQKEVKRQEEMINNLSLGGKRAIRQAKSREKMLDKMKKLDKPTTVNGKAKIRFEPKVKSGNDVLKVEELSKSFDDKEVFKNVSFNIYRGEKVGLIGPNGIGKSTIFKILLNNLNYDEGIVNIGHKVNTAYYDQEQTNLDNDKTIVDEIWDDNPTLDHFQIRSILARFLFTGDDIFKEISTLSGGEKSRVSLIKLMLSEANFLLMDEPTNHLDIDSKEALEDSLIDYNGTLFVISHDRYFLNKVTDKILELSRDGIEEYLGNYNYYIEKKNSLVEEEEIVSTETKTEIKNRRKKEREKIREDQRKKKRLTNIEKEIASLEKELTTLEDLMCKEEVYSDPDKSLEIHQRTTNVKNSLEELYEEWENLLVD
ncbi:ABC-F family ATP-binding cassette domain-containing protein [Clostridium sp. D2Q-11]|uniref:ABC-F family ATP-binding cassette domain-containing protein n=1 Tax=Anaeromonas frigoriresistens TaxID=2683708 RepID=A0A942UV66_9FIRM|nr:ABC-F family ATP-binding cassette domain-containing protein [Anaeromonas frigoriresistens]MBS4538090.1 ABC-F family ATP-binding cassette domain-containing protein [Anaeromonas frigoriresistens]